jgi:hypothetical protein
VETEKPNTERLVFTDDNEVFGDMTIGMFVRFQADADNGITTVEFVNDQRTGKTVYEDYEQVHDALMLYDMSEEFRVLENSIFSLQLSGVSPTQQWQLEGDLREGLEYVMHTESRWLFKAQKIGEYFLTFTKIDLESKEVIESTTVQIFTENAYTTLGNMIEITGEILVFDEQYITVESEGEQYRIFVPEGMLVEGYGTGRPVILGVEVGEASYILRFYKRNEAAIDEASGKSIVRHIGTIEDVDETYLKVVINTYYLELYHNDLATSGYEPGDVVFMEYFPDYESESNELIFIQKVE